MLSKRLDQGQCVAGTDHDAAQRASACKRLEYRAQRQSCLLVELARERVEKRALRNRIWTEAGDGPRANRRCTDGPLALRPRDENFNQAGIVGTPGRDIGLGRLLPSWSGAAVEWMRRPLRLRKRSLDAYGTRTGRCRCVEPRPDTPPPLPAPALARREFVRSAVSSDKHCNRVQLGFTESALKPTQSYRDIVQTARSEPRPRNGGHRA